MSFLGAEPCNYVTARVLWNTPVSRFQRAWKQGEIGSSLEAPCAHSTALQYAECDLEAKCHAVWTCRLKSLLNLLAFLEGNETFTLPNVHRSLYYSFFANEPLVTVLFLVYRPHVFVHLVDVFVELRFIIFVLLSALSITLMRFFLSPPQL